VGVGSQGEELDLEAVSESRRVLERFRNRPVSRENLEEELRSTVRSVYRKALDKRPTVLTVILDE